ncbi:MAG: insulinase family protein [Prevotellaceae bacterium]|nr:insulinase family protein [Prevotellaceae bacterium]
MLDRSKQPPIRPLADLTLQEPRRTTLPNGVQLNLLDAGDYDVVRIDLLFKGGRWHQTQSLQALFTNRMSREGTSRYSAAQIAAKLDFYGAWLELSVGWEYSFITLFSLDKYLPQTLEVLESMVKEPLFPDKELQTVLQTNERQFLVNSSKVSFLAHRALMKALYGGGHPCGLLTAREDYGRITPDVLRAFYNRCYHARNCTVYLSGKVTDDLVRRVESLFGADSFGKGTEQPFTSPCLPVQASAKRLFVERADALQCAVAMGMPFVDVHHPDYLKARVLVTLLGGYFGSRLMSNIREEKGYTYGITAGIVAAPGTGALLINAETTPAFVEPLIAEVYREIDRLHDELVPGEELTMVKNYLLGDFCRTYESALSTADAWILVQTNGFGTDHFTRFMEAVKSVTPEEIRQLARSHLCKENIKEVVSGKKM